MALLVGAAAVGRPIRSDVRMRSNVPGRQRWSVPQAVGRPQLADSLADTLRGVRGIKSVRVNSVTGSVLVLHGAGLTSTDVGELLRRVLGRLSGASAVEIGARTENAAPEPEPAPKAVEPGTLRAALAVTGGVVGAAALALG
ncbi:HMA2 domain-containing protein, partial [Streptomyces acidiscabies]|uniref:HMA2 domain-containing protein n=1 Tax=Streptomyces acidiscabies TaxID=42234 RepID=UPI000B339CA3